MEHFKLYNNTYSRDTDSAKASNDAYPLVTGVDFRDKIGTTLSDGSTFTSEMAFDSLVNSVQYHESKDESKFQLYDILTYNSSTNVFGCFKPYETIPTGNTPIAVCVIPEGLLPNDIYGENGDARFMALVDNDNNGKKWGDIQDSSLWTLFGEQASGTIIKPNNSWFNIYEYYTGETKYHLLIPQKYVNDETEGYETWQRIPIINDGNYSSNTNYTLYNYVKAYKSYQGCLPSDAWTTNGVESWFLDCGYSNKTDRYYYGPGRTNETYECYVPSPYLLNGKLNPLYLGYWYGENHTSVLPYNPLSRFDGKRKTLAIVKAMLEADKWLKSEYNFDSKHFRDNNAALYCFKYGENIGTINGTIDYENGTYTLGDWYLPSLGELGFLCVRRAGINNILKNKLGFADTKLLSPNSYWSSSQYSANFAYYLNLFTGNVNSYFKYNSSRVRPFLRKKKSEILS